MGEQAKITSIDVLERFRASLIVFLTKARRCVDQTGEEVRRTSFWVQGEQRQHWETQLRRRNKVLDRVQQELLTAKLSSFRDNLMAEQAAVRRAKRDVEEAESKLSHCKKWGREFDRLTEPHLKRMEAIKHFLDHNLPMAVAYLTQAQRTLEGYAETSAPVDTATLPLSDQKSMEPASEPTS